MVDKDCETVGMSCDMSTLTEVAMLTGVEMFFGSPTQLHISFKTENTRQMLPYICLFLLYFRNTFLMLHFYFFFLQISRLCDKESFRLL